MTVFNSYTLSGRVVVITDAARGIGHAIAATLAAAGADVVGIDICGPTSAKNTFHLPSMRIWITREN